MTHELDARAKELDRAHVFHSWSAQEGLDLPVIAGGSGAWVWNHAGERMLDLSSQLVNVNIGHQHPAVVAAIQEQAGRLATIGPATANLHRGEAAARILDKAPDGFAKVFFTNGGADANENAVRMARLTTGRDTVLSTYRSYHGNTGGAIVATGDWRRMPNQYARGHVHFFGPYLYRSEFWATTPEEECERALHHLRRVIETFRLMAQQWKCCWNRSRARPASSCRRPATSRGSATCATSTESCSSSTRSWPDSDAPASGSPSSVTTSCPTSSPSRRGSIRVTSPSAA